MVDFTEKMRLKGQAEEDIYFAELDRKLIEAMHEKQAKEQAEKAKLHGDIHHGIHKGAQDQQK